ncbi:uncharacterized protein LOC127879079 isoform X2 [Dreissena polymorpha]|uniref:Mitochondria-eating protein C-terminal domain-containing protein n=1 Tax=Dreissena polymorpha TaxID=45954 RepID=A0A9D4K600_DREPO|nr:uncharacterized protein LOC127879079 isoform X2 [Dreissena polymorpha]KAH3833561.1 hypothetical protein DPMN_106873 [Dreissena polymorpha]
MEQSKINLFLEYLISRNTKEAVDKTDVKLIEAQRELEVLEQNKEIISQRVPNIEEHVKTLDKIINLSKAYGSINSAKSWAKSAVISLCPDIELSLKEIRAQQSSGYTVERETRNKVKDNGNGSTAELLEKRYGLHHAWCSGRAIDSRVPEVPGSNAGRKAGIALVHDNPDITDLSDPNRPTKIAERWSELYDNEWTDAFEEEVRSRKVDEKEVIKDLLEVVKLAYQFCTEKAAGEIKSAEAVDHFRKTEARTKIHRLQKVFLKDSKAKLVKHGPTAKSKEFINKCVELCWWMCIQERPVYICSIDDGENADFYRAYTKSGSQLDYIVWPALKLYKGDPLSYSGVETNLKLYKDGPLLYRGVAQFK